MRLLQHLIAALFLTLAWPAQAAVTITFWSHEFGDEFPHTFFTLRGTIDVNGVPVDTNYGFTARKVSPALLFGPVPGRLDVATPRYLESSDAQFSLILTDAQYGDIVRLIAAWDERTGNARYDLNRRNCVHFVKEAAALLGLAGLDQPKLMKRPRSYLDAVEAANVGRVIPVDLNGKDYLQRLTSGTEPAAAAPVPSLQASPISADEPAGISIRRQAGMGAARAQGQIEITDIGHGPLDPMSSIVADRTAGGWSVSYACAGSSCCAASGDHRTLSYRLSEKASADVDAILDDLRGGAAPDGQPPSPQVVTGNLVSIDHHGFKRDYRRAGAWGPTLGRLETLLSPLTP